MAKIPLPLARYIASVYKPQEVAQGNLMGVPVFIKQLGSQPMAYAVTTPGQVGLTGTEESITIKPFVDRAGADPEQWPEHLRVQELPQ